MNYTKLVPPPHEICRRFSPHHLGRLCLLLCAYALSLQATEPAAFGGSWVFTATGAGTNSGNPAGSSSPAFVVNGIAICSGSGPGGNSTYSLTVNGTWQPASGQTMVTDPPPSTVYLLEAASATVQTGLQGSPSALDGLGDASSTVNIQYPNGPVYSYQVTSTGKHIIPAGAAGGTFTASINGQTTGSQPYGSSAGATITFDSRGFGLSSDLGQTYCEGANETSNANVSGRQNLQIDTITVPTITSHNLYINLIGGWSSGAIVSGTVFHLYNVSDTPYVETQTVTVTDPADGTTAQGVATIIEHLPIEPDTSISTIPNRETALSTVLSGISPGIGGYVQDSPSGTEDVFELIDGAAAVATAIGQEDVAAVLEAFSKIGAPISAEYGYSDKPGGTMATNDQTTWGVAEVLDGGNVCYSTPYYSGENPNHVPTNLINDPTGWTHCSMNVNRMQYYDLDTYSADAYNITGYIGSGHWMQYRNYTHDSEEPFFTVMNGD